MNNKIFWLPSWYPSDDNPLGGIFFKKQAEFLANRFDICILHLEVKPLGKKEWVRNFFQIPINKICLPGNMPGLGIQIKLPFFMPDSYWLKKLYEGYHMLFQQGVEAFGVPELIHAHGGLYAGIGSTYLNRKFNIPNLITEHHPIVITDFTAITAKAYVDTLNSAFAVSTVSQYAKRMLMLQAQQCRPVVHGNLVDEERFFISGINLDIFHIGWIGYPSFNKDPFTFLDALQKLKERIGDNFRSTIVIPKVSGDFTHTLVQEKIKANGLQDLCKLKEGIFEEELLEFYNSLSVLVSTSYSETFGLVMAEAGACGVPIVATKSGGAEEVVSNEVGHLVDLQDTNGIADIMESLWAKKESFNPEEVRQSIVSRFGTMAFMENMTKIYDSILVRAKDAQSINISKQKF